MKHTKRQIDENAGFTLVEVLLSMLILSIIVTATTVAYVYANKVSIDNKLKMTAINLANDRIELIRSYEFSKIGTKVVEDDSITYGDPAGEILQNETKVVDDIEYTITSTVSWEDQDDDLTDTDWDYKSVKVEVVPTERLGEAEFTKAIETYVTRDSTQPALTGANISVRFYRGWGSIGGTKVPVGNIKVRLETGPSSPRQVLSSSNGIARFIDLDPGKYSVLINPSNLGMILHPYQTLLWDNINASDGVTQTQEFIVEYPCTIHLTLKDLDGNSFNLMPGNNGTVNITVPYGSNILKDFTSDQIDEGGQLPNDFITDLWPVGASGYTGVYTISDISVPGYQFLGGYETVNTVEKLWNGEFNAPGTNKEIICYFDTIPTTPSDINTFWVDGSSSILTEAGSYMAFDEDGEDVWHGKFSTPNLEETISMPADSTVDYNADSIYFENTGSEANPGLYIGDNSNLILHTGLVIFRGGIDFGENSNLILKTAYEDGTQVNSYEGSLIGGTKGISYGKLYLTKSWEVDGEELLPPGVYYYPDGVKLPDMSSEMISITKDNYIK